jgi:hypothetical protein
MISLKRRKSGTSWFIGEKALLVVSIANLSMETAKSVLKGSMG